jgi:hypothetical protein
MVIHVAQNDETPLKVNDPQRGRWGALEEEFPSFPQRHDVATLAHLN